jgi:hypothetical protein
MSRPSLAIFKLLITSDRGLFEHLINREGLQLVGLKNRDPLDTAVKSEAILAIASALTESVNDFTELTQRQSYLKHLAEQYGYIVALQEGLDQMPGTEPGPIKGQLRHPTDSDSQEVPDEEGDDSGLPPLPQ